MRPKNPSGLRALLKILLNSPISNTFFFLTAKIAPTAHPNYPQLWGFTDGGFTSIRDSGERLWLRNFCIFAFSKLHSMKKVVVISTSALFCGEVPMPHSIDGNDKLQEAYELGKQV
jgi:hypothetical protein